MKIFEVVLTGKPQQVLPNECGVNGCLLLRPFGAAAILIGDSAGEVNLPLPVDVPVRLYPDNTSQIWCQGTLDQTLHLVAFA